MSAIASMTGYASAKAEVQGYIVTVDLRSINSRFLEIFFKYPDETIKPLESNAREIISSLIKRGKVECTISFIVPLASGLNIKWEQVDNIAQDLNKLSLKIDNPSVNLLEILNLPQVQAQEQLNFEALKEALSLATKEAATQLKHNKEQEGYNLVQAIMAKLVTIEEHCKVIATHLQTLVQQEKTRLVEKFEEIKLNLDSSRLEQEIVLAAQKADIAEEYDRLCSHIKQCREILKDNKQCGKKLDFLMQEFNREANTIASKSSNLEITNIAIELKVLIEQIREQVQNIE